MDLTNFSILSLSLKLSHYPLRVPKSPKYQHVVFKFVIIWWKKQLCLQPNIEHRTHDDLFPPRAFLSVVWNHTVCFCSAMFRCGMQKDIRTHWNRAAQCNQGKTKTTKNLLQIHISSTSFLNSGNLEMFHNELKDWTEVFGNSTATKTTTKKKTVKMAQCQNWNRGSLWKLVQCVTLLTSCKDRRLWKTATKFTGICHWTFEGWAGD